MFGLLFLRRLLRKEGITASAAGLRLWNYYGRIGEANGDRRTVEDTCTSCWVRRVIQRADGREGRVECEDGDGSAQWRNKRAESEATDGDKNSRQDRMD